jgi:hypothetical protein
MRVLGAGVVVGVAAATVGAAGAQESPEPATPDCRVSLPDRSRPPGEGFRIPGNGHLWAGVPADGRIVARPRGEPGMPRLRADGSVQTKMLWFGRLSSKTRKRKLTITGRRLDGDAKPIRIGPKPGGWNGEALYWPGYVTFPEPGCWKVAGTAGKGTRLVFVVSVEPPPDDR